MNEDSFTPLPGGGVGPDNGVKMAYEINKVAVLGAGVELARELLHVPVLGPYRPWLMLRSRIRAVRTTGEQWSDRATPSVRRRGPKRGYVRRGGSQERSAVT